MLNVTGGGGMNIKKIGGIGACRFLTLHLENLVLGACLIVAARCKVSALFFVPIFCGCKFVLWKISYYMKPAWMVIHI